MENNENFLLAVSRATIESQAGGIGTLGEKMLHRTLKYYFEPNPQNHEIEYLGSVADIKNEDGIIEIQTRSFGKLSPKLKKFLPSEKVKVIYPIIERKSICRIDTESGESLPPKKSPKRGSALDALPEIAEIREFIPNDNLCIVLVFLDVIETRLLSGKKKVGRQKTAKIDSIPTSINSIVELRSAEDFVRLLPKNLPNEFTSADFEKLTRIRAIKLHNSLMFLINIGILSRDKRGGRSYIYSINPKFL